MYHQQFGVHLCVLQRASVDSESFIFPELQFWTDWNRASLEIVYVNVSVSYWTHLGKNLCCWFLNKRSFDTDSLRSLYAVLDSIYLLIHQCRNMNNFQSMYYTDLAAAAQVRNSDNQRYWLSRSLYPNSAWLICKPNSDKVGRGCGPRTEISHGGRNLFRVSKMTKFEIPCTWSGFRSNFFHILQKSVTQSAAPNVNRLKINFSTSWGTSYVRVNILNTPESCQPFLPL